MPKNTLMIIIAVAVLVGGFFAYRQWLAPATDESLAVDVTENLPEKAIIQKLNQMKQIKLDQSVLSSAAYKSLKDGTVTIEPVEPGRANPFAPVRPTAPVTPTKKR